MYKRIKQYRWLASLSARMECGGFSEFVYKPLVKIWFFNGKSVYCT